VNTLALKLVLIPALTAAASLAGRRWGPAISGWLIGLPTTSAPIIFFLALGQGTRFAAETATGTLSGGLSLVGFCLTYRRLARRFRWPAALGGGLGVLLAGNLALQSLSIPPAALLLAVIVALLVALRLIAPEDTGPAPQVALPGWDIPARMVAATAFVLLVTEVAPLLGPRLSGLAATFPLVAATLTVFAHEQFGAEAAGRVLGGLLMGLFAFTGFYGVLITLLVPAGIGPAFGAAILAALIVQGGTLWVMRSLTPAPARHPSPHSGERGVR
jgi:hypothetical protein